MKGFINFNNEINNQDSYKVTEKSVEIKVEMESGNTVICYLTHESFQELVDAYEEVK